MIKAEKFYEEVIFSEEAPDIEEYKKYYESIDPENAEYLYKQVVAQIETDKIMDEYKKGYTEMKPKQAAAIFEEMTDNLRAVGIKDEHIVDGSLIWRITEGRQYFDLSMLKPDRSGEAFADLGACDGMSSVEFLRWCEGNGYCYCFEPDRKNIDVLKRNMQQKGLNADKDFSLIAKGAWSESTELLFNESGSADSHFVSEMDDSADIHRVQVVA